VQGGEEEEGLLTGAVGPPRGGGNRVPEVEGDETTVVGVETKPPGRRVREVG
jgi:hypothetical protein